MACAGIASALPVPSCEKYDYALIDNKKCSLSLLFFFFTSQINKPFIPYNISEHSVIKRSTLYAFEALIFRRPHLKPCTLGPQILSIAVIAEAYRCLCSSQ